MILPDLSVISIQTLQTYIDDKVLENKELEYKDYTFPDGKMEERDKTKLAQEIVSFANADGGTIIIGIQEDENRFPTKITGAGFTRKEFDKWLSSCRQLILSRIRPHLHGIEYLPVELEDGSIAIVISIPKSFSRPHSFWDGNKDTFFIRYANGKSYMDIDDLRKQFLFSGSIKNQIKQFRSDRISMILANECVGNLGNDAKLLFHIIPVWSFVLGNSIDIRKANRSDDLLPLSGNSYDIRYNADGYCVFSIDSQISKIETYTQLFHNGIIEAVEIRLFSGYREKQVYNWEQTQGVIIKAAYRYADALRKLSVPKPWYFYATILNAKGYVTTSGAWGDNSEPLERDVIHSQDGIWNDEGTIDSALKPVLDTLSNAFGYSKSTCFDDNGKIKLEYMK